MDNWGCCKCSVVQWRCTYTFLKEAVYNYLLSPTRNVQGVFLCLHHVARCVSKCQLALWFTVLYVFWHVSDSVHVRHRIPEAAHTHTHLHTHTHTHTRQVALTLLLRQQISSHFPPGSRGIWGKFNDAAKSILFEIPRDVGRVQGREVRLCQAGVCKWETGDRSWGGGGSSILPLSCGLALTTSLPPHIVSCFYINYNLYYQLPVANPSKQKRLPPETTLLLYLILYLVLLCVCVCMHAFPPAHVCVFACCRSPPPPPPPPPPGNTAL